MNWLRDIIGLSGIGLALYGLALWSTSLACVVGGVVLFIGSLAWASIGRQA